MVITAVIRDYAFVSTEDIWMHLFLNERESVTNTHWIGRGGRGTRGLEENMHNSLPEWPWYIIFSLTVYRALVIYSVLVLADNATSKKKVWAEITKFCLK